MSKLTHVADDGKANMVDVTDKAVTQRTATAEGTVYMSEEALSLVTDNAHKKGDVLQLARIAGIMAAKKCADLIPLCHPLLLSKIQVDCWVDHEKSCVRISSLCKLSGQTGVEMEALTAISVAALTVFDMCKAVDPAMVISDIKVNEKQGGKTGHWERNDD